MLILTLLLSVTLCLMFPGTTPAQPVNIPDANLRAAIAEALGNQTPGAPITAEAMATLTIFNGDNDSIRDLKGLEAAIHLREVYIRHNFISDLSPLSGLIQLRRVNVEDNAVSDLSPLSGLIHLEHLQIHRNLVSDLSPIAGLIHLRSLDIAHNVISDLSPIAGLIQLQWIGMTENPLADLSPLTGLISLRIFHSWGTPVLNLSALTELPKLREIDICGGDISDISALEGFTTLKELYLRDNEVSDIAPLATLTGLTHLSLEDNHVSDVSALAALPNLTWINLTNNEVVDFSPLDVFPEDVFIARRNNPGFTPSAPKIEGPWLWVIVPTNGMSGSKAAASGTDFLAKVSGGAVTELGIARQGATEGDAVGEKVWTLGKIPKSGGNNINELVNTLGLGTGNVDHHVAYGSVNLDSPRLQNTKMFVGSGDAVKVWLNGVLIHNKAIDREADDYEENFPVTLKEGTNTLLIAVYEGQGWWSGFFGFDDRTKYTVSTQSPPVLPKAPRVADINEDGRVTILDLILVARDFQKNKPISPRTDVNGDGVVNILDLHLVAGSMDERIPAAPDVLVSAASIQAWIAQAHLEDDGSLAFRHGIASLQRLLASLAPKTTTLLANYPNPCNPETWIPYQLAAPADVQIRLTAASGTLVRTLHLGHQPAGRYQDRDRAAYWDGKNEMAESVASGVYFYTLTAGDFTATRKMLIRK